MIDALASEDPILKSVALGAACRLNILDLELLRRCLTDPSAKVRRRALELAPRAAAIANSDGQGSAGDPGVRRHHDDDHDVKDHDDHDDDPDRLGHDDPDRLALARAVRPLLDDDACAEVAAFALGELGVDDDEIVAGLAHQARHHADPLCRESAVAALGSLGRRGDVVVAATADIATVRRRAIIALSAFEGPDVDEALTRALGDRDWQVRQAAEDLLDVPPDDDGRRPDDDPTTTRRGVDPGSQDVAG